jgi:hypothetical protein
MRQLNRLVALTAFTVSPLHGQDTSGDWQGALSVGSQELRLILHIAKGSNGDWTATMVSIGQSPDRGAGMQANAILLGGLNIKFSIPQIKGSYDGKLSADGATISGTWTQGRPLPLEFRRATKETAWPGPHRTPHSS